MTDDDPHTIATVEASLREDGGTARELRLASQQTERLNIVFHKETIAPDNAFARLRRAIAPLDEWRLDEWQPKDDDDKCWVWYCC